MSTASSGQQVTDSLNGKLTFEQDKNRIVGRDENNLVRLLVLANGTDFVFKIAKPGFDALTASNNELIFNSDQNVFKIVKTDTIPYSYSGGTSSYLAIPHNLGYTPIPLVFISAGTSYVPLPTALALSVSTSVNFQNWIFCDVDNVNLNIYANYVAGGSASGISLKYYLLQESAN